MTLRLIDGAIGGLAAPVSRNLASTYFKLLSDASKSSKAQEMLAFIRKNGKVVGLLLVDMTSGSDSMFIPPSVLSAVPELKEFDGGVAVVNIENPLNIRGTNCGLAVSTVHELGHAKQFMERPQWFEGKFAETMRSEDQIRSDVNAGLQGLTSPKERSAKRNDLQAKFALAKKQAKLDIENDNLQRHEKPMLMQMGLPFRDTYD